MSVFLEVRHRITSIADTAVPAIDRHGIDLIGAWKVTGGKMG